MRADLESKVTALAAARSRTSRTSPPRATAARSSRRSSRPRGAHRARAEGDRHARRAHRAAASTSATSPRSSQSEAELARIAQALDASEAKNKDQQVQLADLGRRLNQALASKVEELARYRSEFFGRLREVLGDRPDIRIVGDRFVFQSEVLFRPAAPRLSPRRKTAAASRVADAIKEIAPKIPTDIPWVLQVDGHTDKQPISTPQFPSNWELSTARALSVVRYLVEQGIPPDRLSPRASASIQPVDPRRHARRLPQEPPHRAEADRALSAKSTRAAKAGPRGLRPCTASPRRSSAALGGASFCLATGLLGAFARGLLRGLAPALLGAAFVRPSWPSWPAFLRACLGPPFFFAAALRSRGAAFFAWPSCASGGRLAWPEPAWARARPSEEAFRFRFRRTYWLAPPVPTNRKRSYVSCNRKSNGFAMATLRATTRPCGDCPDAAPLPAAVSL